MNHSLKSFYFIHGCTTSWPFHIVMLLTVLLVVDFDFQLLIEKFWIRNKHFSLHLIPLWKKKKKRQHLKLFLKKRYTTSVSGKGYMVLIIS